MKNRLIIFCLLFLIIGCNQSDKMTDLKIYEKQEEGFAMFYQTSNRLSLLKVYNTKIKVTCDGTEAKEILLSVGVAWDKIKEYQTEYNLFSNIELPPKKDKVYNEVRLELKGKPIVCKLLSKRMEATKQDPIQLILEDSTDSEYLTLNSYELMDWSFKEIEYW